MSSTLSGVDVIWSNLRRCPTISVGVLSRVVVSGLANDRLGRHVLVVEVQLLRADSNMWCGRVVLVWWLR